MRSVTPMKTAKTGYIIISVMLCVLGILLIVIPDFSAKMLGIMMGILMIVFGSVKLVGYFSRDLYRLAFQYDLAFGLLLIVLGVLLLIYPANLMNFFCIVLGISILMDGLFKIQIAMDSRQFGIRKWWLILLWAVVAGIMGLLLVIRPTESVRALMILSGITLLAEGFLNLSTVLTVVKIIRHQLPDMETEYREVKE